MSAAAPVAERLLTAADVAAILQVDESTVFKWERLGHLRAVVISPATSRRRTLRFELAEVRRLIAAGHPPAIDESSSPERSLSRSARQRGTERR